MDFDAPLTSTFPPTREAGLQRLEAFVPRMGASYASKRNTDRGPEDRSNISGLSPYHSHRLVLESETLAKALEHHGENGAEAFLQEVLWRGYFKGWLEQHPQVWTRYRRGVEDSFVNLDSEARARYDKAVGGETGIACFDAWARELIEIGYLHNHSRMWFASIWIFTLGLPWDLGADFFYRHLLDGDAASNTLSWRWAAGLHTKGKSYLATPENIERYTEGRFPRPGNLAPDAPALEDDWNDETQPLPAPARPEPGVPSLLLLHEDDLAFETLGLGDFDLKGTAAVTVTDDRSPFGASEQAKHFTINAVEDALNRADDALPGDAEKLLSFEAVAEHAREIGAEQIIYPYAPVGPVKDRLMAAAPGWNEAGLEHRAILRAYDETLWPHCGKGYFGVKKKMGDLLPKLADR
jgi:deoxyribodipyrimidine photo-lyase